MYLRLKENCIFTDINTGISKTATINDYLILRIFNLSFRSSETGFYGEFYINIFWDLNVKLPFYTQQIQLLPEIVDQYRIIPILEGTTEIDVALLLQQIIYQFLVNSPEFADWELVY